ncbi:hypothetical protein NLJ89_g8574 [Agrocybe chaxingu]|uniref:Uncharacterized protein n=1 Tax=Agrocybe chaxingu TaxID=84603 RepID=A0A9W8K1K0_9AGAR|nr:hypothetical protein NLJ89_g8574 [Agrocybe chaxingu]
MYDVNWGILQHLTASFDVHGFLFVAKETFSLRTCSLRLHPVYDAEEHEDPRSPITLPELRELHIYLTESDEDNHFTDILSNLIVPLLHHVEVNTGLSEHPWVSSFITMITRSDSRIDTLVLVTEQLSKNDIVTLFLLPNLASLTRIHIDTVTSSSILLVNEVLERLNPRIAANEPSIKACLLKLQVLSYAGECNFDSVAGVVSLIKSRAKYIAAERGRDQETGSRALRHVRISYRNYHQATEMTMVLDAIANSSSLEELAGEAGTKLELHFDDSQDALKDSDYYFRHYTKSVFDSLD